MFVKIVMSQSIVCKARTHLFVINTIRTSIYSVQLQFYITVQTEFVFIMFFKCLWYYFFFNLFNSLYLHQVINIAYLPFKNWLIM